MLARRQALPCFAQLGVFKDGRHGGGDAPALGHTHTHHKTDRLRACGHRHSACGREHALLRAGLGFKV